MKLLVSVFCMRSTWLLPILWHVFTTSSNAQLGRCDHCSCYSIDLVYHITRTSYTIRSLNLTCSYPKVNGISFGRSFPQKIYHLSSQAIFKGLEAWSCRGWIESPTEILLGSRWQGNVVWIWVVKFFCLSLHLFPLKQLQWSMTLQGSKAQRQQPYFGQPRGMIHIGPWSCWISLSLVGFLYVTH